MYKSKIASVCLCMALISCADKPINSEGEALVQPTSVSLETIIDSRDEDLKARDSSRNPQQTIEFFGIEPGMKVAEVLPGGGWYTQIIAPYIGSEGEIVGINYADDMWERFGFFSDEVIAKRIASSEAFAGMVNAFPGAENVPAKGVAFNRIDESLNGTLDAVLLIRAMHNLNRFEDTANTLSTALEQIHKLLKPGGIVGIVQHRAPADSSDEWAVGKNGYLKQAYVIAKLEQFGFEWVGESDINANVNDQPTEEDYVWRLPPSLRTADDNKSAMKAIGESDRMTLKFIKR